MHELVNWRKEVKIDAIASQPLLITQQEKESSAYLKP